MDPRHSELIPIRVEGHIEESRRTFYEVYQLVAGMGRME
jgi:hypothetical protein